MLALKVIRGPDEGRTLELEPGRTYTVGCDPSDSLVLKDPMVLKGHCAVQAVDDALLVKNQTASQGTFVGDKKIAQAKLRPGTSFRVGDTTIAVGTVRREPAQPAASAAPAGGAPTGKPSARARKPDDGLVGRIIGGYKIKEVVGEGGMGKVYRATQLSLHRDVALKVLRDELAKDKQFRELFINEAQSAAQLVHPNVVQVYDAGREGDITFFSMEFIGQGSVEEILERDGKIAWSEAILMVLEAAHGLDYAEGKGIVHRDIKPDNLMLNEDGRIKIADLGLAKRGEGEKQQGVIGTPHFIPPEQAMGKDVDTRADIYSLGATFFRMITGRTLFRGATAKEIVLKHVKEPPPAASSIDKEIPDDLDLVLARMLAKEPDQRYATAKELIAALEEVCAHHGIKGSIIKKGVSKRVLIPLVVLVLAAGGVALHFATKEPEVVLDETSIREAKEARRQKQLAEEKRKKAELVARQGAVRNEFQELENRELRLQSRIALESVYDDPDAAPNHEAEWGVVVDAYRDFAKDEEAREFGFAEKAEQKADEIEKQLREAKEAQETKRAQIGEQVEKVKTIAKTNRAKLADLRQDRRFEAAVNVAARLADLERKDNPLREVRDWVFVNPVSGKRQPATAIPKIMAEIEDAAGYFRQEHVGVMEQAKRDWEEVATELKALAEDAPDARLEELVGALEEVQERYPAEKGPQVEEIRQYVRQAKQAEDVLEKTLRERVAMRLAEDRKLVRFTQRRYCSLLDAQLPNSVMRCDFGVAINEWNRLLDSGQVKTELYRAFVKERVEMLRYAQFLFARLQADLAQGRGSGPFRSLTIEIPLLDGKDRILRTTLDEPEGNDPYVLHVSPRYKGESFIRLSQFPMDWIYTSVFHVEEGRESRWNEVPPAIEFALGAFCFETMMYRHARKHFERLVDDEKYGEAARALAARAAKEHEARAEWETLCQDVMTAESTDALAKTRERLDTYGRRHAGRIFWIEVMERSEEVDVDFHDLAYPKVPDAPPPQPARPEK